MQFEHTLHGLFFSSLQIEILATSFAIFKDVCESEHSKILACEMFFEKDKLYNNFSLDCKEIPPFKLFQICLHLIQK